MARLIPQKWSKSGDDLPPPKRISTPAGLRLSVIMNEDQAPNNSRDQLSTITSATAPRLSLSKEVGNEFIGITVTDTDLESAAHHSAARNPSPSPPYTKSTFSEKSAYPIQEASTLINSKGPFWTRRRTRLALGASLFLSLLIIGLAVGLTRKHHSATVSKSSNSGTNNSSPPSTSSSSSSSSPSSSSSSASSPATKPNGFPLGSYSMYAFLDTVTTDCTSNPSTWTCPPNVIFNDDSSKALSTFSYTITGSSGSYQLTPTSGTSPFGDITFNSTPLKLMGSGESSENYAFHVTINKAVNTNLDGQAATCYFNATTFQGNLYTQRARDYPLSGQQLPSGGNQQWPFAMRFEEVASGDPAPSCYASGTNKPITKGISARDGSSLCNCLYRNWRTPSR